MATLSRKEVNSDALVLEQLPCEIIISILSLLDWRDLVHCCTVSPTLRMCARDNLLWRRLYMIQFPSDRYANSTTCISSRLISLFVNSQLSQQNYQDVDSPPTTETETTITREKPFNPSILGEDETMEAGHWQRAFSIRYSCYKRWLNGQQVLDHSYTVYQDLDTIVSSIGLIPGSNTLIIGTNDGSLSKLELPPLLETKTIDVDESESPSPKRYKLSSFEVSSIRLANNFSSRIEGIVCSENTTIALHRKSFSVISNDNFTKQRMVDCHLRRLSCVRLDGNIIVTGSWDRTIKIIDLHTGDTIGSIKAHTAKIKDLVLTPELIISCSNDRHIKFFDRRSYSLVHDLQPQIGGRSVGTCALALNTEVNKLAIGLRDARVVLCDFSLARHSKHLQTKPVLSSTTSRSNSLRKSNENKKQAQSAPVVLQTPNMHSPSLGAYVRKLQIDEHKVLSLQSKVCRIWDVNSGQLCYKVQKAARSTYVDALFDDTRLITASASSLSVVSFI
jgi:WD40 repeat protein